LSDVAGQVADADLLTLDEALTQLAVIDARAAELVALRYFTGLTITQAAEALAGQPHPRPPELFARH
jgi:hypothetical protein